jgi:hypothetical protein
LPLEGDCASVTVQGLDEAGQVVAEERYAACSSG